MQKINPYLFINLISLKKYFFLILNFETLSNRICLKENEIDEVLKMINKILNEIEKDVLNSVH